ncbi:TPA: preprotein translocase subunit SecG [Legionella pneumophila]|uniref:Protein-export membrane protein SecG n=3 Tax=Legionella pneumophila TaxID=446 RepID=A0A1S0VIN1_LEGPN|nr:MULTISPECIES: preprotein translocase subunit SecG [Legionella]ERH40971.1 preprotein translocase subunit SecG [Legionella pneumophila str. Leg01/53]ERH46018.1 preprotein translocase subunit SecG [Legionella pneumophila str. Leg01/11]ERI49336.1 preprotein translocase subunit SecG [Legionella pneumophila str. Leg01/20]ANH14127.1 preprotein translocase subunit SecG [Legionella pneumophila]ANH17088.1 preprotein translocase subunit SecG [Legionella pneumophila]
MYQLILMIHVLIAVILIGLVLIQHGKGADIGAAFGSGASNTLFGSQGTGGFLFKLTGGLAMTFFITSLMLSYMVSTQNQKAGQLAIPQQTGAPVSSVPVPVEKNNKK